MGCIHSKESATTVEIRRKRKSVRERISGFILKRRHRGVQTEEDIQEQPEIVETESAAPSGIGAESQEVENRAESRDSILSYDDDDDEIVYDPLSDDNYSYSLRCEESPVSMHATYSEVSVTDMIDIWERSRSRAAQKTTSTTSADREETKSVESSSNQSSSATTVKKTEEPKTTESSCSLTPSTRAANMEEARSTESSSNLSHISSQTWTVKGNVPSVSSSFEESIVRPNIDEPEPAVPAPQLPQLREDLKFHYPSYRVDSPHTLRPSHGGMCIDTDQDVPEYTLPEETKDVESQKGEDVKRWVSNLNSQEDAENSNTGYATASNAVNRSSTFSSFAATPFNIPGAIESPPESPSPPLIPRCRPRPKNEEEYVRVLMEAQRKPPHRPQYVINTSDPGVRPRAAWGPGRLRPIDGPSTSTGFTAEDHRQLQKQVRVFNARVNRLFDNQPQQTQPSQRPYDRNRRPKAARGVRNAMPTCSNPPMNRNRTAPRSYSLRPQLTQPALRLPEQDALDNFARFQQALESDRPTLDLRVRDLRRPMPDFRDIPDNSDSDRGHSSRREANSHSGRVELWRPESREKDYSNKGNKRRRHVSKNRKAKDHKDQRRPDSGEKSNQVKGKGHHGQEKDRGYSDGGNEYYRQGRESRSPDRSSGHRCRGRDSDQRRPDSGEQSDSERGSRQRRHDRQGYPERGSDEQRPSGGEQSNPDRGSRHRRHGRQGYPERGSDEQRRPDSGGQSDPYTSNKDRRRGKQWCTYRGSDEQRPSSGEQSDPDMRHCSRGNQWHPYRGSDEQRPSSGEDSDQDWRQQYRRHRKDEEHWVPDRGKGKGKGKALMRPQDRGKVQRRPDSGDQRYSGGGSGYRRQDRGKECGRPDDDDDEEEDSDDDNCWGCD